MNRRDFMLRNMFALVTMALLATLPASATGGDPMLQWVDIDPEINPKLAQTIEGQCLPTLDHFAFTIPVVADVLFVSWDGERPLCRGDSSTSSLKPDSVIFLSPEKAPDVIKEFRNTLSGLDFTEHALPRDGDTDPCCVGTQYGKSYSGERREKTIFIQSSIDRFCWNKHLYQAPTVIIKGTYGTYADIGYETLIEIFRPDLSMASDSRSAQTENGGDMCG